MERAICIPIKIIKLRSRQRVVSKNFKETQNEAVRYSVLPTKINLFLQNCRDWAKSKNERINWTSPTLIFLTNTFSANFRPALPVEAQHTIVRSPIIIIFLGFGYRITKSISPFAANGLKRKHFYWVNNSYYIAYPPVYVCVYIYTDQVHGSQIGSLSHALLLDCTHLTELYIYIVMYNSIFVKITTFFLILNNNNSNKLFILNA